MEKGGEVRWIAVEKCVEKGWLQIVPPMECIDEGSTVANTAPKSWPTHTCHHLDHVRLTHCT